jgi:hypothetical protein
MRQFRTSGSARGRGIIDQGNDIVTPSKNQRKAENTNWKLHSKAQQDLPTGPSDTPSLFATPALVGKTPGTSGSIAPLWGGAVKPSVGRNRISRYRFWLEGDCYHSPQPVLRGHESAGTTVGDLVIPMFEYFTDRARAVVATAPEIATLAGASEPRTTHILLAILFESRGIAANVLRNHAVDPAAVDTAMSTCVEPDAMVAPHFR